MPGSRRGSWLSGTILTSNVCARGSPVGATVTTLAGNCSPGYAGTVMVTSCAGFTAARLASSTVTWISTPADARVSIVVDGVANAPAVSARLPTIPSNGATTVV